MLTSNFFFCLICLWFGIKHYNFIKWVRDFWLFLILEFFFTGFRILIARLILSGVFVFVFFFLLFCPAQPALPWPARCDSFHLNFGIPSWARLYNGVFGVLFHRNPEDIQNGTRPEWAQAWSVSAWESDLRCHILDSHASKILVSRQRKAMLFFFFFFFFRASAPFPGSCLPSYAFAFWICPVGAKLPGDF